MDPKTFLEDVVRPNVEDMKARYEDVRLAFNAVAAVDSLAAHLYVWCLTNTAGQTHGAKDDSDYREKLAQQDPEFALLRDIAKANKHVHLTRGTPQVTAADQISAKRLGWGTGRWGEMKWDSPAQVVADTNAGESRVVEAVVDRALAFIETEMRRVGAMT